MSDVTHILERVEQGDPKAADELLPLVYDELRKLEDLSRTLRVSSRPSCNESGCTDQRGSSNQNDNHSLVHEGQPSEAAPQTGVDTNRSQFHVL